MTSHRKHQLSSSIFLVSLSSIPHGALLNTILGPVEGHPSTWTSPW
jgi:hypothetical protein